MEKRNVRAKTSAAIVEMVGCFPNQIQTDDEDQVKAAAAGVNLLPELISDILSRLPAKSVGRFRCVSKHWQTLLSDHQFLKIQFTRNNHQTKVILCQERSFLSIDLRKNCNSKSDPVGIYETLSFKPANFGITIRGSCNGLLLLYDYQKMGLSIANPITHESRQLPTVPKSIDRQWLCKFGFGYCTTGDEYTVIIISDHTRSSPVYMLKKNLWKRVENSPFGIYSHYGAFENRAIHWVGYDLDYGAFVNEAIHWLFSGDLDQSKMIYAFDLACERFREVEQPVGLKKEDEFVVDILGGCLCLVVHHKKVVTDIWVMKVYGVRESWTKYSSCYSLNYRYSKPLFFWKGEESIVAVNVGRFVLCRFKQTPLSTLTSIPVNGDFYSERSYADKWTFVDSLFSPNCSNAIERPNQVQV